ncbi:signal peptidase I [Leptospira interrogans]|uniref:Signal peptidase I n=16 Tax=Leptospira interrogans TaxID=173 RepID=Q8EZU7_LEPIN|nr:MULTISPECIES: signal peptidase I [Leptospira]EMN70819.1 signal peptidase I [Leptospira interrogans serovar Bataviae str. UI 08561]AAN50952.1 signal peptidase I [Leptospira interrogans serovar Lai str. 56601]AER03782.1 signal peptidase I [Leptospira interrogans serovar Lai str. IPAV]AKP27161.1 signal peptidase I [Leptospira interrogans serovar Manilae]AKP30933.1 signal peptidase I [Leptospira interrogans serovar Manilae]
MSYVNMKSIVMQKSTRKYLRVILPIFLSLFTILLIRIFLFQIYFISGYSMAPSYKEGDLILVTKFGFPTRIGKWEISFVESKVNRFDVLVLDGFEEELSLKRVVGLPGDYFRFENDRILINDSPLQETFLKPGFKTIAPSLSMIPMTAAKGNVPIGDTGRIPPGYFLMLGDNRENSTDSRNYGLVPFQKLRGRVWIFL